MNEQETVSALRAARLRAESLPYGDNEMDEQDIMLALQAAALEEESGDEDPIYDRKGRIEFHNLPNKKGSEGLVDIQIQKAQNQVLGSDQKEVAKDLPSAFGLHTLKQEAISGRLYYPRFTQYSFQTAADGLFLHKKFLCPNNRSAGTVASTLEWYNVIFYDPDTGIYEVITRLSTQDGMNKGGTMTQLRSYVLLAAAIICFRFGFWDDVRRSGGPLMWGKNKGSILKQRTGTELNDLECDVAKVMAVCFALYFNIPESKYTFNADRIMKYDIADKIVKTKQCIANFGVASVDKMTDDSLPEEDLKKYRACLPFPYFLVLDALLPEQYFRSKLNGANFHLTAADRELLEENRDLSSVSYGKGAIYA